MSKPINMKSKSKARNTKFRSRTKQVFVNKEEDKNNSHANEIDISKGISDLKVAYNPDFGYGEMFNVNEKHKPSPWKIIADAIIEYPHFQISTKVIDEIKKENTK